MTLRILQIFLAVYRQESITRAAEELHMTQPAVTRAIHDLERDCGVPLFERLGRRLHITEAGHELYSQASHIMDAMQRMEAGIRKWDAQGVVRVGTTVTIGTVLLPRVLAHGRQSHPLLQIRAQVRNGAALQQALLNNQLDFALIEGQVTHPDLESRIIAQDHLIPVLPPQDPRKNTALSLEDLSGEPLLLREAGSMGRSLVDQIFSARALRLQPTLESISTQAILQAVKAGLGIAFLPEHLVSAALAAGEVSTCVLTDADFSRHWHLVWHKHKHLLPHDHAVMDLFCQQAAHLS